MLNKRALLIALVISVGLHAGGAAVVAVLGMHRPALPAQPPMLLVDIDVHEPPAPEEADMPQEPEAAAPEAAAPEPVIVPEVPESPPEDPEVAELPAAPEIVDAGVPDAPAALAEAVSTDGGPADAAMVALADAGAPAPDAAAVAGGPASDAAPTTAAVMPGPADAGAPAAAPDDTGPASAPAAVSTGPRHPGSQANLLDYTPPGEVVSVMIRFDRLRDTPWAPLTEAILAPMPDYRGLVGPRQVSITMLFDTLVISSAEPTDVMATTLAGHTRMSGREVRAFLDHPAARVRWSAARGGALGRRLPSPIVPPGDPRVFLMPHPSWVVLSRPEHLGVLVQPAGPAPPSATTPDIDTAVAAPADLPRWLTRIPHIEAEAGTDRGPAVVITIAGMLPATIDLPQVGTLPAPDRLSLALEVARGGFQVRGTMLFASPQAAAAFVATADQARTTLSESLLGKALLARAHAQNAVRGLSLRQNGAQVGYATSISVSDGRAMLELAAVLMRRMFIGPEPGADENIK